MDEILKEVRKFTDEYLKYIQDKGEAPLLEYFQYDIEATKALLDRLDALENKLITKEAQQLLCRTTNYFQTHLETVEGQKDHLEKNQKERNEVMIRAPEDEKPPLEYLKSKLSDPNTFDRHLEEIKAPPFQEAIKQDCIKQEELPVISFYQDENDNNLSLPQITSEESLGIT